MGTEIKELMIQAALCAGKASQRGEYISETLADISCRLSTADESLQLIYEQVVRENPKSRAGSLLLLLMKELSDISECTEDICEYFDEP